MITDKTMLAAKHAAESANVDLRHMALILRVFLGAVADGESTAFKIALGSVIDELSEL